MLIDISPTISPRIAVYPGDKKFSLTTSLDFSKGDNLKLSSIEGTLHLGAHTDAPNHYHRDGCGISERGLDIYYGDCQVIKATPKNGVRLHPEDLGDTEITAPRVLFCTNSFPNPDQWNGDFVALSPELVDYLAAKKVCLVGIDTPSVDPADSKELESHQAIYSHDMAILEGIVLTDCEEGLYKLIALPLKLEDADASPVRAVLEK